jgi:hypothetical protein
MKKYLFMLALLVSFSAEAEYYADRAKICVKLTYLDMENEALEKVCGIDTGNMNRIKADWYDLDCEHVLSPGDGYKIRDAVIKAGDKIYIEQGKEAYCKSGKAYGGQSQLVKEDEALWKASQAKPTAKVEFYCMNPDSEAESFVCGNDELITINNDLNVILSKVRSESAGVDGETGEVIDRVGDDQKRWATDVRDKCQDAECFKAVYSTRIAELNQMINR